MIKRFLGKATSYNDHCMINMGSQRPKIGINWPLTGPYLQCCTKQFYCCLLWWKYRFCCCWERKHLCFVRGSQYVPASIVISLSERPTKLRYWWHCEGSIKSAISIHDLHHLLQKMVFVASDSGVKGGIAAKFRKEEELSWLSFICCLSHQLNLQYLTACLSIYQPSNNVYIIFSICIKNPAKNYKSITS